MTTLLMSPPTPLPTRILGDGPAVVLVHGVGLGPEIFDAVAVVLADAGRRVVVVERPGYGVGGPGPSAPSEVSLDAQTDRLAATLDSVADPGGRPPDLVGVSGGATLGLAFLLAHPGRVGRVLLHEPLVGPLAPALHRSVSVRAVELAIDPAPEATETFVAGLVGPSTWGSLEETTRAAVRARTETIRAEVPPFAGFGPSAGALGHLRVTRSPGSWTVSTGLRSGVARHQAAAALGWLGGATTTDIPDAGHLAPLEAPAAFARAVRAALDPASMLDGQEHRR